MEPKKVRWGVLGTARIADAVVRGIRLSSNSDLAAIASRDASLAQEWATRRDVPHVFGSYDEMLASDVIDAVYVPLPNGLHKEWSIKAMQQGKHVLCEKPLAASADDVREMMAAADANNVKLMEAFMYRFHPQTERVLKLLAEGIIGDLKVIRATFGFVLDNLDDVRWRPDLAGGSLMDVGCYCVNVSRLVAGGNPVVVTARQHVAQSGVDDLFGGVLEFSGGLLGLVDCDFQSGAGMQQSLSISGTRGRINVAQPFRRDENPVSIVIDRSEDGDRGGPFESIEVSGANQYHLMVESFADAVLNHHPTAYTLEDSLGNMQVIDALKESARTGRAIQL
ncbi:MAG: Gfo/Idh/MocA family oxidoreductase [Chloroflexota bacterium]